MRIMDAVLPGPCFCYCCLLLLLYYRVRDKRRIVRTPGKRRRPIRGACPFQRGARQAVGSGRADGWGSGRGASWITNVRSVHHLYVRKRNQSRSRYFPCRRCCTAAWTSGPARTRRFSPVASHSCVLKLYFHRFVFALNVQRNCVLYLFFLFLWKFFFSFTLRGAVASKLQTNFVAGSPSRWTRIRERRRHVFGQGRSAPVRNGTLQETFESKRRNDRPQTERIVAL